MVKRVGIIGVGTVGAATIKSLRNYSALIKRKTGIRLVIDKVCDVRPGAKKIASKYGIAFTNDAQKIIYDPKIDAVVELIGGINPARDLIVESLKQGKEVITANKALLAVHGKELFALAEKHNRSIGFEASVCGAIPIIKSISKGLVGCEIQHVYGILNGTTNYILDHMERETKEYREVLQQAQQKGLAEKNPHLDVDGIDALHKLCILSYLCFGIWPPLKKITTEGITHIELLDILYAQQLGYKIKLLAIAKKDRVGLDLRVQPAFIARSHPLAQTADAFNAVYLDADPAGPLMFHGLGAGGAATSSAVIADIVRCSLGERIFFRKQEKIVLKNSNTLRSRYYIRCMVQDQPGVLACISNILASHSISIASVNQKQRSQSKYVPIVMITHEVKAADMNKALVKIDRLAQVKGPSRKIRIEKI